MLTPDELRLLHPRKQLAAFVPLTPLEIAAPGVKPATSPEPENAFARGGSGGSGAARPKAVSATYVWSGLMRIDVGNAPPNTTLVFYGPPTLRVTAMPLAAGEEPVGIDEDSEETVEEAAGKAVQGLLANIFIY